MGFTVYCLLINVVLIRPLMDVYMPLGSGKLLVVWWLLGLKTTQHLLELNYVTYFDDVLRLTYSNPYNKLVKLGFDHLGFT